MEKKYIKPIQPTPTLSGKDARAIIKDALTKPSRESINKNEERLLQIQKAFKL